MLTQALRRCVLQACQAAEVEGTFMLRYSETAEDQTNRFKAIWKSIQREH